MKKYLKQILTLSIALMFCMCLIACGNQNNNNNNNNNTVIAEKIELSTATLDDIEFENDENSKINKEGNTYKVSGTIAAMSESQKTAFGVDDVTHVVSLKFIFDKEKTISTFKIQGETTKVFSVEENVENYVGSITDLLDSEENEDAYCYLILSANTSKYTFTATYSDKTSSIVKLDINATLATANID